MSVSLSGFVPFVALFLYIYYIFLLLLTGRKASIALQSNTPLFGLTSYFILL